MACTISSTAPTLSKANSYQTDLNNYMGHPPLYETYTTKYFKSPVGTSSSFNNLINTNLPTLLTSINTDIFNITNELNTLTRCIGNYVSSDSDFTNKSKELAELRIRRQYLETLKNGTNVRFDDSKYIYNHNMFKMIYLLSGIGYMSFIIFKSVK